MSGLHIEATVNEADASFQDYMGLGVCHIPPPKRMKVADDDSEDDMQKEESLVPKTTKKTVEPEVDPRSVDVFLSQDSLDSLEGYQSALDEIEDEEVAIPKKKKRVVEEEEEEEEEDEVVENSQDSNQDGFESDCSLEMDAVFLADLDKTPPRSRNERNIAEDRDYKKEGDGLSEKSPTSRDTDKLFEEAGFSGKRRSEAKESPRVSSSTNSIEDEEMTLQNMLDKNFRTPSPEKNNAYQQKEKINQYDRESTPSPAKSQPDVFMSPESSQPPDAEFPVRKSADLLEFMQIGSVQERLETAEKREKRRERKEERERKAERERTLSPLNQSDPLQMMEDADFNTPKKTEPEEELKITPTSMSGSSSDSDKQLYAEFLQNEYELRFKNKGKTFRPDFLNSYCNYKNNYVYCDFPANLSAAYARNAGSRPNKHSPLLFQPWNEFTAGGAETCHYSQRRALLSNYAKMYKNGGYHLFAGLLETMWGRNEKQMIEMPALEAYFRQESKRIGEDAVIEKFANVVRIALQAEELLPNKIYKLCKEVESVTFSQRQCAAILSWMFFIANKKSFYEIITGESKVHIEKLKFLFHYFDQVMELPANGCVSFRRVRNVSCGESEIITKRNKINVRVRDMRIEESALCTQVDFANASLGGGVLRRGSVQEEIRFLMCPEHIVGMHLCSTMSANEAISIVGAQAFSSYSGYGYGLKWEPLKPQDARQNEYRDKYKRLLVETIAIDALDHGSCSSEIRALKEQLRRENILREYRKAVAGFISQGYSIPIVSGWWGCGAFKGNKPLKVLIQACAAADCSRPLWICSFGDARIAELTNNMMRLIADCGIRSGEIMRMLIDLPAPEEYTETYVFDSLATIIGEKYNTSAPPSSSDSRV